VASVNVTARTPQRAPRRRRVDLRIQQHQHGCPPAHLQPCPGQDRHDLLAGPVDLMLAALLRTLKERFFERLLLFDGRFGGVSSNLVDHGLGWLVAWRRGTGG